MTNKEKVINGVLWFSGFSSSIFLCAIFLYAGFNNLKYGNYIALVIWLLLIPVIFFCAYKGLKLILSAIFD